MAIMQYDGNFMVYKGVNRFSRKPLWTSNTNVKGDYFIFQNDGNLEIFAQNEPIWTANTKNEHANKLIM
jgi:hypothetical protein